VAPATEMRTAQAMVAAAMEMAATVMTMAAAMPSPVAPAMPSSVASATPAERHARQQGRQNKNGNSNGWFGHGTLPTPFALRLRHHNDANGNLKFHRGCRVAGCQSAVEQGVKAR
jgi:hypothetical protein